MGEGCGGGDAEEGDGVVGAEVEDGGSVADGSGGEELGHGRDAVAVEVRRNLNLVGIDVEIGDRVGTRFSNVEDVGIGGAVGGHVVISGTVDERVGPGAAE